MQKVKINFRLCNCLNKCNLKIYIYDENNCLVYQGRTTNYCGIYVCLCKYKLYKIKVFNNCQLLMCTYFVISNSPCITFTLQRNNQITFNLTDTNYIGLPIAKGVLNLWPTQ